MKMKNELFEIKQYFETIGKIHQSDQLSVMDAYRINRLSKKMTELYEEYMVIKRKLFAQYGTPGEKEGTYLVETENREAFAGEYNDLISIEHDLETEMLAFPSKLEDGISATDLNVMELFFDLSGLEEKTKDEPDITSTEKE